MSNSAWDDVRKLADEVRVKMHLAGMELKEKWKSLEPQLAAAQRKVGEGTDKAEAAATEQLGAIAAGLRQFVDELTAAVKKSEPAKAAAAEEAPTDAELVTDPEPAKPEPPKEA